ncbi:hypothetical protein LY76DRAFT_671780 [Colletotrichum caudatum]|nr:hypothetical protein LY76DRAFT_671780 [Colletotrichum caudatum]
MNTSVSPDSNAVAPFLRNSGASCRLVVDGKPFLILDGEITPFSATSAVYMAKANICQKVKATGANTASIAVTWEAREPIEGHFGHVWFDNIVGQAPSQVERLAKIVKDAHPVATVTMISLRSTEDKDSVRQLWSASGPLAPTEPLVSQRSRQKAVLPKATSTRVPSFHKLDVNRDGGYDTLRSSNADGTGGGRVAQVAPTDPMIAEVRSYSFEAWGVYELEVSLFRLRSGLAGVLALRLCTASRKFTTSTSAGTMD